MENRKATKRALLTSITALVMCVVMLVGTTFAWFTDTASTNVNRIQAGNLDVQLLMEVGSTWENAEGKTLSFLQKQAGGTVTQNANILWEPGCTYELPKLKVVNNGNLNLKYKVIISGATGDTTLLDVIDFSGKITDENNAVTDLSSVSMNSTTPAVLDRELAAGKADTITLNGTMQTSANNTYMNKTVDNITITVVATQATGEYDSTRDDYDETADYTIQVNKDNIQDYLDGKYGSIDGMTLVLAAGEYDTLELGRATKYPGSNTQYMVRGFDASAENYKKFNTAEALKTYEEDNHWNPNCYYIRSMSNVTIKAAAGAEVKVAGLFASSGHINQNSTDYVLDKAVQGGIHTYFLAQKMSNITIEGITFTAKTDINTSIPQTTINGFTFKNCIFNIGDTTDNSNYIALRYYNENNNGNVRNLVVDNCTFKNCRQGVYTCHVYGVSVTNSTFNTTGHNAIAVQAHGGNLCNHGKVVITGNVFDNIGDRIIRFNEVGADTQITIKKNIATNSGNTAGEVIKAEHLADGIKYDISDNNWGDGKSVGNPEFADKISN